MRTRTWQWLASWLEQERRFALASRLAAAAVVGLWLRQAYVLGWTRTLLGSVAGQSAWSERDRYAALGIASLEHLSATNIARSVMVLPLVVLLAYALVAPARIRQRGLAVQVLFLGALAALGVYSIIVKDVPFNFYGSRYFLPVVVPLVMLVFGAVIASWRRGLAACAAGVVLATGGYHALGLAMAPAYENGVALQAEITRRASAGDVTFLVGAPPMRKTLMAGIMGMSGGSVVFVDTTRLGGAGELQAVIDDYMRALHAEQAVVVSELHYPFVAQAERVTATSSAIPFAIRYNTYERSPVRYRYYVGNYRDQSTLVSNERPEWIVGGALSLPVSASAAGSRLVLRTGGGWLWATRKGGGEPHLALAVDGVAAPLLSQQGSDFVFAVPRPGASAERIEIRSSTFVPAEVGINADRRALGADLLSLRFENAPPLPPPGR